MQNLFIVRIPRKSRRPKSAARGAFVLSGVERVTPLLAQWAMGNLANREKYFGVLRSQYQAILKR